MCYRNFAVCLIVACLLLTVATTSLSAQQLAFQNVSVISFEPTGFVDSQTVVVADGKIVTIGPTNEIELDDQIQVIDASGKFLMPGMVDSHAHLPGLQGLDMDMRDYLLLQLAHGVTSLRVSRYEPEFLELRETICSENWGSPRLFLPAPAIHSGSEPIVDPVETFQQYKAQGYDHIKYLSGLTPIEHEAYVRAAHKTGLPIYGHLLPHLNLEKVIQYRQSGIEHLHGFTKLHSDGKSDEIKRLITHAARQQIFMCPTASWYNGWSLNFDDPDTEFHSRPGLDYMPRALRESWDQWLKQRKEERIDGDKKIREKVLPLFVDSGVPMLISPGDGYYFVPGLAMLTEMNVFAKAGFSNAEILKAATYNGADFYGKTSEFGNIRVGLRSDLVLLGGNPMNDLENVHSVEGVMCGDRWYDKQTLTQMLDELRSMRR